MQVLPGIRGIYMNIQINSKNFQYAFVYLNGEFIHKSQSVHKLYSK